MVLMKTNTEIPKQVLKPLTPILKHYIAHNINLKLLTIMHLQEFQKKIFTTFAKPKHNHICLTQI